MKSILIMLYFFFFSGLKIKHKENNWPESDNKNFQSQMTLNPTCDIFSKQNSKLNLEITPHCPLSQKSISASLNSLLLPEDTPCLNTREHLMFSPGPLPVQQITAVSKSLIPESTQPSTSSYNVSVIADLHLSTIDWEGTSFSNSPAIPRNTSSHGLKSELETAIAENFKNIPEQSSFASEWCTTDINEVLDRDLQKIDDTEEHLLSGITNLHLQDLPLKERIRIKSSYPPDNAQPNVDLKTLSLVTIKESCIANNGSDCQSHLSKDLLGNHLQNESRKSKVLKGDYLFQENHKMNTSVPYSVNNPVIVKTSRIGPSNTALDYNRKADVQSTQKSVMKKSVCLDRHSSDEESVPVFGKAKYTTQKMKPRSQKHYPAPFKKDDANKLNNPKIHIKETEQCAQAYDTAGKEDCFPDAAKGSLGFLQRSKDKGDCGTCLDSPLPLCQRLKLRFQNS